MTDLTAAVRAAVGGLNLSESDKGAAELAITYAQHIDDGGELEKAGPLLLAALEALLMTPRARAAAVKGGTRDSGTQSPLDELRARRAGRQRDTAAVDTPAP